MTAALSVRCLGIVGMLACVCPGIGRAGVELISVGVGGAPANGPSPSLSTRGLSTNGRLVVFGSQASNLVSGDTNGQPDVFVRDRTKHTTRLVSLSSNGAQGNARSGSGAVSQDGRFVAFASQADNLVSGDTNGVLDVFVRDLRAGTTKRVSVATDGTQANSDSYGPSISADGRYVAFTSFASNLVPRDTNGRGDVFLYDRQKAATFRVSLGAAFGQANDFSQMPVLSHDARFVVFLSDASNLVPGDTNFLPDIFVRDRRNQTTRRVSLTQAGAQLDWPSFNPAMTPDGRYVAFDSDAPNIVPGDTNGASDIFVRDLRANTTNRVSLGAGFAQADGGSFQASISADGKRVAFASRARLVAGDKNGLQDVYLRDRGTQSIRLLSVALPGVPGGDSSFGPAISADGHTVAFATSAANLVPGDTNGVDDVFVAAP